MKSRRIFLSILILSMAYSLVNLFIDVQFSAVFSSLAIIGGLTLIFALFANAYQIKLKVIPILRTDLISLWVISIIGITIGFSSIYLDLARQTPDHFSGMIDGISALYFSVNTFATVGFGDIYPLSPIARLLVMSEILVAVIVLPLTIGTYIALINNHIFKQQNKAAIQVLENSKQRQLSRIK